MKKQIGILAAMALFAAAFISCASPSAAGERIELHAVARLSDGSELKGMAQERTLDAESGNVGAFKLDLAKVAEIRPGRQAPSTIVFADGDTLHATLSPKHEKFTLESLLGRIDIPFADIRTLTFSKRVLGDEEDLLYYCTFDDAASIESPQAGPSGKFLAGEFVPGKVGNALRVHKGVSSATVHFDKGVLQPRGTIEFWAKIENERDLFGDGGDPRFFMMETAPESETVFQLVANDGHGRGGLSIYNQGCSAASENHCLYPAAYSSVLPGETKSWHHYALVWDENGIPELDGRVSLAAFIDGKRIPLHGDTGLAKAPHMAARFRYNPATLFFSLNPERNHGFNNKTDFLIDEFKIFAEPRCPANPF